MIGRRRLLLAYPTLILLIVGAAAHGFLSHAVERMQQAGVAFAEGTTLTDRGTLPSLRGARQLSDARQSRAAQNGKVDDGDALPTTQAASLRSAPPATALPTDLGRAPSTASRSQHRPRDPPASA